MVVAGVVVMSATNVLPFCSPLNLYGLGRPSAEFEAGEGAGGGNFWLTLGGGCCRPMLWLLLFCALESSPGALCRP